MARLLPVLLSKEAEEAKEEEEEEEEEEASPVHMPGEAEVRGSATKEDNYSAP